ncbi:hypothetical protein HanRHA438_Chr01g0006431 [Helianthus annuus]|nr:hypothetical protein HanIR_Chr11g0530201 [Helianthus annuus]KAJ0588114.1 hypothetical protein HanIR_Chr04g0170851 [Helianthus annuus]KAJ0946662.1 hypothetical protein HanRHA438_Chr01g0006431 [Helianthus annuus]
MSNYKYHAPSTHFFAHSLIPLFTSALELSLKHLGLCLLVEKIARTLSELLSFFLFPFSFCSAESQTFGQQFDFRF